jgi:hypothetical protein
MLSSRNGSLKSLKGLSQQRDIGIKEVNPHHRAIDI